VELIIARILFFIPYLVILIFRGILGLFLVPIISFCNGKYNVINIWTIYYKIIKKIIKGYFER